MVRMGYAPAAERFETVVEHVIKVQYEEAPERASAVMEALEKADVDRATSDPRTIDERSRRERLAARYRGFPLELRLAIGSLSGILLGVAAAVLLALVSGEPAEILPLVAFGTIGLVIGTLGAMTMD
jgi:hypothetical protein